MHHTRGAKFAYNMKEYMIVELI